ncbi:MAG: alpha/beta hydrolase [Bacteroidales bacterium]
MLISSLLLLGCSSDFDEPAILLFEKTVVSNVEYTISADTLGQPERLLLDIYKLQKTSENQIFPVVLFIHGGGYQIGDKDWVKDCCKILADSGFIVANMNYRMGWRETVGCAGDTNTLEHAQYRGAQDANAALRFLKLNTSKYNIDPEWIFIGGESAGAAIALNCSYMTDVYMVLKYPELVSRLGKLQNPDYELSNRYKIKGICNKWGCISDSNLITQYNAIPTISFHGTYDNLVPVNKGYFLDCHRVPAFGSIFINRQLQALNCPSILHLEQGGGHPPKKFTPEITMPKTAAFFHQVMAGNAKSSVIVD